MKPNLRRIHSPDAEDLDRYVPQDPARFGLLVQLMVGPSGAEGEESFDLVVCSPRWLEERVDEQGILDLRHHLLLRRYDWNVVVAYVHSFLDGIEAETWPEVAAIVGRLGRWEFEDYQE